MHPSRNFSPPISTHLKSCKPHQPVESVMIGGNDTRPSFGITRFTMKLIFLPNPSRLIWNNGSVPCTLEYYFSSFLCNTGLEKNKGSNTVTLWQLTRLFHEIQATAHDRLLTNKWCTLWRNGWAVSVMKWDRKLCYQMSWKVVSTWRHRLWEFDFIIMQNISHNLLFFCALRWPSYHVIENHIQGPNYYRKPITKLTQFRVEH